LRDNKLGSMITFPQKSRTDKNGTLSLAIATGLPNSEVEVVVVVEPAGQGAAAPLDEWPEGYFAETFGSLRDAGLKRPPQGELLERLALDPVHD
jgi:hypothetical protein